MVYHIISCSTASSYKFMFLISPQTLGTWTFIQILIRILILYYTNLILYDTILNNTIRCDAIRYDTIPYHTIRYYTIRRNVCTRNMLDCLCITMQFYIWKAGSWDPQLEFCDLTLWKLTVYHNGIVHST